MVARICEIFTGAWIMFHLTGAGVSYIDRSTERRRARRTARAINDRLRRL